MIRTWVLFAFTVFNYRISFTTANVDFEEIVRNMKDPRYGTDWMYFPDGNGVPQVANLTDPEPNLRQLDPFYDDQSDVTYFLYRRSD